MTIYQSSRVLTLWLCLSLVACNNTTLANTTSEPEVKLSTSGICHDSTNSFYERTKNYKPFTSMDACIDAGGRLPKGKVEQIDKATTEAIEQNRAFVRLYNRDDWPHWLDSDNDCQNTRHEILIQTSLKPVEFKTVNQCIVLSGEWYDPYSGDTFTISNDLDLDHIVPLKFAHGHGADIWDRKRKAEFANDPDNLILTELSLNRQKGAKGLDEWLPPNHPYRCKYIARFNAVMAKYELAYIATEQRIVNRLVKACQK
ncbi:HNH endonuclease family protein [Paraglaciecola hydrolytica]|uniref:GmrSD restriction endonucleases C-terminal domain-containing protein n=1 Tax=Paraglaciecola hydrolytica TaxID=1799789 RepID=A0A136A165_9ALTE|nr:HNH endonuclease family protein [Paraglaciecola hydrolytica]KXI28975.1 hypothetical protein AX660_12425 [Paraglaciecola hydrolytica]